MILILLVGAIFFCGLQALRAQQLLTCALWLAAVSALLAITFYHLGAPQAAAIELSVGAGLITVLFVFAITMAGAGNLIEQPLLPRPLAWGLVLLAAVLLGWFILRPAEPTTTPTAEPTFAQVTWQQRSLDVPVQVILIFSGVLGVLGLLAEPVQSPAKSTPVRSNGFSPSPVAAISQSRSPVRSNGFSRPLIEPTPQPAEVEKAPL